jgi:hypothetical protein
VLLDKIPAYLVKTHALVVHIDSISNLGSGILHLGYGIRIGEFTLAVSAVVVLCLFVCAIPDNIF